MVSEEPLQGIDDNIMKSQPSSPVDPETPRQILPARTAEEQTPSKDLTNEVRRTEDHYFAYGGFSEVYRGEWTDPLTNNIRLVAIKLLRGIHTDRDLLEAMTRRMNRETRVWHELLHPNILPFLGVCHDLGPSPAMVSPMCDNGPVDKYLLQNPEANRLTIITGAARGLAYLHSQNVVHGDLKARNVLMSDDGTPLLADFGRSKFIDHRGFTTAFSGSARSLAPELLAAEADLDNTDDAYDAVANQTDPMPNLTKETDVFGFSMVALEIYTGKLPYYHILQESAIIHQVQQGSRPDRLRCLPATFTDPMWALLTDCWKTAPNDRPVMETVVHRLEEF
jgi:serine/threonine protein kinase